MKVKLLVTVKGNDKLWLRGAVLEAPFHPDIKGFLHNPNILEILPDDKNKEVVNGKKEEKKEEASQGSDQQQENKEEEIKAKPVIKKGNRKSTTPD